MRSAIALATALGLLSADGAAADPAASVFPAGWRQGWARSVEGRKLSYRWGNPGFAVSLLCRAVDTTWAVEWEGEAASGGGETVTWVWHVGLNSGTSPHRFELQLDGRPVVAFDTAGGTENRTWRVEGRDGARLELLTTRIGSFDERFGFMALTVPRARVGASPPRFRIVPEVAGSQDYVLVFEEPVTAWAKVAAEEAVLKGGRRLLTADLSHLGPAVPVVVKAEGREVHRGALATGHTRIDVGVPEGVAGSVRVAVEAAGRRSARRGGAPAPRGPAGAPRDPPLARGHRLLRPPAGGGAQAVGEPPRRARALREDEGYAARGAFPLGGRGPLGRGELPRAGVGSRAPRLRRGREARRPRASRQPDEPADRSVPPGRARPVDGRVAPAEAALRDRDLPGRHAHGHPRPGLADRERAGAGRRALLLERPELHAEPEARRRRPHRTDARGARRPAFLVGLALGPRAPADVGRRPRLLLVPRWVRRAGERRRHARHPRLRARAHGARLPVRARPGPLHGRRGQRARGPEAARVRGGAGTRATRPRASSSTRRRASSRPSSGDTGRPSPRSGAT